MPQSSTQNAHILSLPPELLQKIVAELSQSSNTSVQALLRTCKQFYNFALPYSVETFRAPKADGDDDHSMMTMLAFLRYITITKPHVADMVTTIIAGDFSTAADNDGDGDGDEDEDGGDQGGSDQDADGRGSGDGNGSKPQSRSFKGVPTHELSLYKGIINSVITEAETEHWETWSKEWFKDLKNGVGDACVALLLAVCSNVQTFCFGEPYNPRCVPRLVEAAAARNRNLESAKKKDPSAFAHSPRVESCLQNLHDVFHESEEGKYGYLMFAVQAYPFLQLPAIRTWECVMANGEDDSAEGFLKIERGSSQLQHMLIRKSSITASVLNAVVGACHALRSFEYSRGIYHMYDLEFMPRDLMVALLPHASTLESLYVNFEDDWQKVGWEDHPNSLYLGIDLKKMTALRELTAGMQALTGLLDGQPAEMFSDEMPLSVDGAPRLVDCLPPHLEYLEIHGCGKAILEQAQELIDAATADDGDFSKLTRIKLLFNAEKIEPEEVNLRSGRGELGLKIIYQKPEHRKFDLCPSSDIPGSEDWVRNICTRIADPTMQCRDLWLHTRGSDKGEADVNGTVTSFGV